MSISLFFDLVVSQSLQFLHLGNLGSVRLFFHAVLPVLIGPWHSLIIRLGVPLSTFLMQVYHSKLPSNFPNHGLPPIFGWCRSFLKYQGEEVGLSLISGLLALCHDLSQGPWPEVGDEQRLYEDSYWLCLGWLMLLTLSSISRMAMLIRLCWWLIHRLSDDLQFASLQYQLYS